MRLIVIIFLILCQKIESQRVEIFIDYSLSKIQKLNNSFYIGEIFFANLISPYQINYSNLPTNWIISGGYIYIPTYEIEKRSLKQLLLVSVSDKFGRFKQFSLYVISKNQNIYFSPTQYSSTPQIVNSQQSNLNNNYNTQSSQLITQSQNQFTINHFQTIQNTVNTQTSSFNQIQINNYQSQQQQILTPQQLIDSIEKRPQFNTIPITQIIKPIQYEVNSAPYSQPIQINSQDLPIQQRIRLILQSVEQEYNSIPQTRVRQTGIITVKPIDSIFSQVPPIPQLKQLLKLSNPALYLSKSAQQAVSSETLNCEQKIAYLLQIYGITQAHIEIIEGKFNQISIINSYARDANQYLKQELTQIRMQIQMQSEQYQLKQQQLAEGLQDLSQLYSLYNQQVLKAQLSIRTPYNARFANKQYQKLQNQLQLERQKMKRIQYKHYQSQKQVKAARQQLQRKQLQAKYYRQQYQLQKQRLSESKQKVLKVQQQMQVQRIGSQGYLDQLKLAYLKKQVQVSRFRSNLNTLSQKQQALQRNLKRLQNQISINYDKIDEKTERQLQFTLQNLNMALPNLQTEVDRIYYRCYRAGNIQIRQKTPQNQNFIYIMKRNEWVAYMNNVYGVSQSIISQRFENRLKIEKWGEREQVAIYPHNIFSNVWTESLGQIQRSDLQRIFELDFTCLKPSTLETSSGILKFVWKNILIVQDMNDRNKLYELKLGSCSRIQVINQIIPKNGMYIYWRGNLQKNGYNIYLATFV